MKFSPVLLQKLRSAKSVAALTGAGISAESGVPTFRGEGGWWKKYRAEELANFDAFMRNPELVWEWYNYRKNLIAQVQPNPGHFALAEMEGLFPAFTLITQNVDGLHRRAGSTKILELHGNIQRSKCVDCDRHFDEVKMGPEGSVPRCDCGGLIRPDVVWFGETLPQRELELSFQAAQESEVFFSIGTSAVVQPAASLPLEAKQQGAYVVEVNFEKTTISDLVGESILGKSGEILPQLVEAIRSQANSSYEWLGRWQ